MTPPKVFVADDQPDVRDTVIRCLEKFGLEVEPFSNGQQVWNRIQTGKDLPDLIVSDINMPELDGITLYERIRDAGITVPVVLVTGDTARNNERLQQCKAPWVIQKPFMPGDLKKVVQEALQSRLAPPAPPAPEIRTAADEWRPEAHLPAPSLALGIPPQTERYFEGEIDIDRLSDPASWADSEQDTSRLEQTIAEGQALAQAEKSGPTNQEIEALARVISRDQAETTMIHCVAMMAGKTELIRSAINDLGELAREYEKARKAYFAFDGMPTNPGADDPDRD